MRIVVVLMMCLFGVASCASTAAFDKAMQKNLPQICNGAAQFHAAFLTIAATGKVKESTIVKERASWAALQRFCANPTEVNGQNALVAAAEAYAAYLMVIRSK